MGFDPKVAGAGGIRAAPSAKPAPSSDWCSVRSFSCSQVGFSLLAPFSCSVRHQRVAAALEGRGDLMAGVSLSCSLSP